MARARNLKPGFFMNENLAELDPLARILFQGLWCLADREGRLEDRPKRIKAEVLPYDNCDADAFLDQLQEYGFIIRYEASGNRYIQVLAFNKHQNPHKTERASTIPAPGSQDVDSVEEDRGNDRTTVNAPCNNGTRPADSLLLIPDPLSITNPDGLVVGSDASDERTPQPDDGDEAQEPKRGGPPACPHQQIIDLYHEILPTNPRIREWTKARAAHLRARWNEEPKRQSLEWWRKFFERIATACPFLTGAKTGGNGRPFMPGLEWMVKAENFTKILEGRYVEEAA